MTPESVDLSKLTPIEDIGSINSRNIKDLYRSLCIPSTIHAYSLCIEYMKKYFLDKFNEGTFAPESIHVDGRNIFDDFRRLKKSELLRRRTPFLTIQPSIDWSFTNDNQDISQFGLNLYRPISRWRDSFFIDFDRNLCLGIDMQTIFMPFTFRVFVETRAEQMDLYKFMRIAFKLGGSEGVWTDMDFHIPYDLIIQLAKDAGFRVDSSLKGEVVYDVSAFLRYLNLHSKLPFVYKLRTINGRSEFFLRMHEMYVHVKPNDINADDGERESQITNKYGVEYTCEVRFPAPMIYSYYSRSMHNINKLFNAERTPDTDIHVASFYTFKSTDIPDKNDHGWQLYLTTTYENDTYGEILEIEFGDMFKGDIQDTIDYCLRIGVSPSIFLEFLLVNNGEYIDYTMDWDLMKLTTTRPISTFNTFIGIYSDTEYLFNTVELLKDNMRNRVTYESNI